MSSVFTPLRYPGGKSIMSDFFKSVINSNNIKNALYAEPYAGGAGAAINLLLTNKVKYIYLNDANLAIYAFWYSLLHNSESFMELFESTRVCLTEWQKQRQIVKGTKDISSTNELTKLGFATFYLNRCNRSGILNAGPIGGQSIEGQQQALYKIDARYKKDVLREKLKAIINVKCKIKIYNDDALVFLKKRIKSLPSQKQQHTLVYLDPPYYLQGSKLYFNYYKNSDHEKLAKYLNKKSIFKWILSYDYNDAITKLYDNFKQYTFNLSYSAQMTKKGKELLIHSNNVNFPMPLNIIRKKKSNRCIELKALYNEIHPSI